MYYYFYCNRYLCIKNDLIVKNGHSYNELCFLYFLLVCYVKLYIRLNVTLAGFYSFLISINTKCIIEYFYFLNLSKQYLI